MRKNNKKKKKAIKYNINLKKMKRMKIYIKRLNIYINQVILYIKKRKNKLYTKLEIKINNINNIFYMSVYYNL